VKTLRNSFVTCIFLLFVLSAFARDNSFKLDFDGDGGTDLVLYREGSRLPTSAPQPSYWYYLNPLTGQTGQLQWGRTLDVAAPADYDNDGITDVAVYRWWDFDVGDVNQWWIRLSSTEGHIVMPYLAGYAKFNRNYIGDARAEVGQLTQINISQDPTETCYVSIYIVVDTEGNELRKTVGDACNVIPTPAPGDYDNDGRSEIAVFNNHTFKVWFAPYNSGYTTPNIVQFLDIDSPAPGDYDGDGKTDFAGIKRINGRLLWVVKSSISGDETITDWGYSTDTPVPGDYDADGKTDLAVFRSSEASWWVRNSSDGSMSLWFYGYPTDVPLAQPVIPFDPTSLNIFVDGYR
jgi:hypothetical protein